MLDDLDRELWRRGHRFVPFAGDIRVFMIDRLNAFTLGWMAYRGPGTQAP
ncbi:hypothetical protein [Nonomuraea sp. B19D2]